MAPIALPPAATVPPEIVGHILDLALEGDPDAPSELLRRRETLFAFGAVCRAWSAEASRASSVTVTSAQEAVFLRIALERRERERRELDAARGRGEDLSCGAVSTPSSYPTGLVLVQGMDAFETHETYRDLVRACPALDDLVIWEFSGQLDSLLLSLKSAYTSRGTPVLRRLELHGRVLGLLRLSHWLASLPLLEVLNLSDVSVTVLNETTVLFPISFPRLRGLSLDLSDPSPQVPAKLFNALINSTTPLKSLTLKHLQPLPDLLPLIGDALSAVAPHLVQLAFEGDATVTADSTSRQHEMLSLLATMTNLEALIISLHPDPLFFTTLRNLVRLVRLRLSIHFPIDAADVAAALRDASFRWLEISAATWYAWDEAGVEVVRSAAEAAGIFFRYRVQGTEFIDNLM